MFYDLLVGSRRGRPQLCLRLSALALRCEIRRVLWPPPGVPAGGVGRERRHWRAGEGLGREEEGQREGVKGGEGCGKVGEEEGRAGW